MAHDDPQGDPRTGDHHRTAARRCGRHATFVDFGSDYYESRVNLNRMTRNHVRELKALGYKVTLEPAA